MYLWYKKQGLRHFWCFKRLRFHRSILQKRLLLLILEKGSQTIFWTGLVSRHYARKTLDWFEVIGVAIVPKNMSPQSCLKLCPIELY